MTITNNLENHLKWLNSVSYLERDPRFDYGIDLKEKYRNCEISFEKFGDQLKINQAKSLPHSYSNRIPSSASTFGNTNAYVDDNSIPSMHSNHGVSSSSMHNYNLVNSSVIQQSIPIFKSGENNGKRKRQPSTESLSNKRVKPSFSDDVDVDIENEIVKLVDLTENSNASRVHKTSDGFISKNTSFHQSSPINSVSIRVNPLDTIACETSTQHHGGGGNRNWESLQHAIKQHLHKEKSTQDTLMNFLNSTIEDLKKAAISNPTIQPLYKRLVSEKNDYEMKIFEIDVERVQLEKQVDELQGFDPSGSSSNLPIQFNQPILNQGANQDSRNHFLQDYDQNPQPYTSVNTSDNFSSVQMESKYSIDSSFAMKSYTPVTFSNYQSKNDHIAQQRNRSSWASEIEAQLVNNFAIRTGFRLLQREAIDCTMEKKDVLVVMPTGGGKSLCYQLPASMSNGVTIVVSPLLSLIQDQVLELRQFGVASTFISSESQWEDHLSIYNDLQSTCPSYRLVYVTPEKINRSNTFQSVLCKMNDLGVLDRFVIDEAHCISKWGQYFRQDYLQLSNLKKSFPRVPILALTATATKKVQSDIIEQLHIPNCKVLVSSFNRVNLKYYVKKKTSHVLDDIADFIRSNNLMKDSGIIYCLSKKDCNTVAEGLKAKGFDTTVYYSDQTDQNVRIDKKSNHESWKNGKTKIICATIAFGMGINKPDVRFVIHHSMPKTIEDYYQESGRAGRDGNESHCLLFYSKKDRNRLIRLVALEGSFENPTFNFEKIDFPGLNSITNYCSCDFVCRRTILLQYFGESFEKGCSMCDVCLNGTPSEKRDVTNVAKSLITIVSEVGEVTLKNILSIARGKGKVSTNSSCFGKCSNETIDFLEDVLRHLVIEGYISQSGRVVKTTNVYETYKKGPNAHLILSNQRTLTIAVRSKISKRSNRSLEPIKTISPSNTLSSNQNDSDVENQKRLRQELYLIRSTLATEAGVAAFNVAGSVTINDMVAKKPKSLEDLKTIQLFPKERIRNYGISFLRVIRQFCSNVYGDCKPMTNDEEIYIRNEIEAMFPKNTFNNPSIQTPSMNQNTPLLPNRNGTNSQHVTATNSWNQSIQKAPSNQYIVPPPVHINHTSNLNANQVPQTSQIITIDDVDDLDDEMLSYL